MFEPNYEASLPDNETELNQPNFYKHINILHIHCRTYSPSLISLQIVDFDSNVIRGNQLV